MAQYLVRVELTGIEPGANSAEPYGRLDHMMGLDGFNRIITGRKARQLPTGTYVADFTHPTNEVAGMAIAAMRRSGHDGRVLVVLMMDWAAKGLVALDDVPSTLPPG